MRRAIPKTEEGDSIFGKISEKRISGAQKKVPRDFPEKDTPSIQK